jgi:hypothetical protein
MFWRAVKGESEGKIWLPHLAEGLVARKRHGRRKERFT